MEWLKMNLDPLLVTIIGGIIVAWFTKSFLSKPNINPKIENNDKSSDKIDQPISPIKDKIQSEINLTSYEKKLYSDVIQFTYQLVDRITILAPLRYPQLEVEYGKFKLFLFNGIKDFNLKLEQSLEVSKAFKSNAKSFLNKIDTNCYKLASFMGKDIGMQNANILEIAQNLKDEIQEFEKTVKQ
ncbi:hypothetical protein ACLSYY_05610 [[Pasteurella] aerogenes]